MELSGDEFSEHFSLCGWRFVLRQQVGELRHWYVGELARFELETGVRVGTGVRLAILAQILLPRFCNARLTVDAWHPKKLTTSDA
jgi:hypothetical protein